MNPETKIQREIQAYLNERKIFNFRVNADDNTVGIPDLIVCYCGMFLGLEVKTPTGKPSEIQLEVAKKVNESGGRVYFPTCVRDVEKALEEVKDYVDRW